METRGRVFVGATAAERLGEARAWLEARAPTEDVLLVGQTLDGARDLIVDTVVSGPARMGLRRTTLSSLASELSGPPLFERGLAAGNRAARDAIVVRAVTELDPSAIGRFGPVADTPGFGRAVGAALEEVELARLEPPDLERADPDLARIAVAVERAWRDAALASPAGVLRAAIRAASDPAFRAPALDTPVLFLDVEIASRLEADLVSALVERAPDALLTIPAGDTRTRRLLGRDDDEATRSRRGRIADRAGIRALDRLQHHLFDASPAEGRSDDTLTVFSAPGEGRECIEIARRLTELAADGAPFDRCAVLLRQPEDYRPHLEEALGRAGIPTYFARGVRRPDPSGRAFLALLRCRAEDYSAVRFAEYLSIGEVPDATDRGEPPVAAAPEDRWVPSEPEDVIERVEASTAAEQLDLLDLADSAPDPPVPGRTLRVPRRWERLLVEASVVGSLDRWERRLGGLHEALELDRAGLAAEDPDDPRIGRVDRDLADLGHLRRYALPLLADLGALPLEADWSEWLDRLGALASRALRRADGVLATLSSLAPLGPVGPIDLDEALRALAPRLMEVATPPDGPRYGRVFVGPIEAARGLAFDTVFIPGLAERVFPGKIAEDSILLDAAREVLAAELALNADRVAAERLALRIAVGAARERVVLSYPRIEADKARPRVPSFYALEAARAAEGRLPGFEELAKRAEDVSDARIGWPAPRQAERAIDEAEYDLAVLDDLGLRGDRAVRAAGHLLHANPHLARALRFRAYRWEVSGWTWADGLIDLTDGATDALAEQSPDARSFSATALQHFAACPYRFYLQALQRLQPREAPVGIEALDPLQRGSLVHETQFRLFTRLSADEGPESTLPVRPSTLERAHSALDDVLDQVAAEFEDRLVPAIDRVWEDEIEAIRADLREWLSRESSIETPFTPWRFELSFGLPRSASRDPSSTPEPVDLDLGLRLRGAIDLIERTPDGVLRVTDHKTGKHRARRGAIIQGGELLQPVLYGIAAQKLFPEDRVESGRLYYCTTAGGYRAHEVPIDDVTVQAARTLGEVVRAAFEAGSFPALPRPDACRWCDYRPVCGPDEERRTRRKPEPAELDRLRTYQ
ncbi:MAG: PD-(D/E)XK nuclease family protein [Gemmatimonadetes bacterium]|nr:PD-(D/E)XK nuclease family protein [Gemmatimonadota bacterium]